jgi:hypothetical protein
MESIELAVSLPDGPFVPSKSNFEEVDLWYIRRGSKKCRDEKRL